MSTAQDLINDLLKNPEKSDDKYFTIDIEKLAEDAAKFSELRVVGAAVSKNAEIGAYFDSVMKDCGITLTDEQRQEALRAVGETLIGHMGKEQEALDDFKIDIPYKGDKPRDPSYYANATYVSLAIMGVSDAMGLLPKRILFEKMIERNMIREKEKLWTGAEGTSNSPAEFDKKYKKNGSYNTKAFLKDKFGHMGKAIQAWVSIAAFQDFVLTLNAPVDETDDDKETSHWIQVSRMVAFVMSESADLLKAVSEGSVEAALKGLNSRLQTLTPGTPEYEAAAADIKQFKASRTGFLKTMAGATGRMLNMYGAAMGIYRQVHYNLGEDGGNDTETSALIAMSAAFGAANMLGAVDYLTQIGSYVVKGKYDSYFLGFADTKFYKNKMAPAIEKFVGKFVTSMVTKALEAAGKIIDGLLLAGGAAMIAEQIIYMNQDFKDAPLETKIAMIIEFGQVVESVFLAAISVILIALGEEMLGIGYAIAAALVVAVTPTAIVALTQRLDYSRFLYDESEKYKPYGYDGDAMLASARQAEAYHSFFAGEAPLLGFVAAGIMPMILIRLGPLLAFNLYFSVGVFVLSLYYAIFGMQQMLEDKAHEMKADIEKQYGSVDNYIKKGMLSRIDYFFDQPEVKQSFRRHLEEGGYERVLGATSVSLDRYLRELSAIVYSSAKVSLAMSQARELMDTHYAHVEGALNPDTNVFNISTKAKTQYVFILRQLATPTEKDNTRLQKGKYTYDTNVTYRDQDSWKVVDSGITSTIVDTRGMATTLQENGSGKYQEDKHNWTAVGRDHRLFSGRITDGLTFAEPHGLMHTLTKPQYDLGWGDDTVIMNILSSTVDGGEGLDSVDYSGLFFEGTDSTLSKTDDKGTLNLSNSKFKDLLINLESYFSKDGDPNQMNGLTVTSTDDTTNKYTIRKRGFSTIKEEFTAMDTVTYGKRVERTVYLAYHDVTAFFDNTDTLTAVERITGSRGSDRFTGGGANDYWRSSSLYGFDNDTLDGGNGDDTVDYRGSNWELRDTFNIGISADLKKGEVLKAIWNNDAHDKLRLDAAKQGLGGPSIPAVTNTGKDTVKNFENVIGTSADDVMIGSDENNNLIGVRGDDWVTGNGGKDYIQVGDGSGRDGKFVHLDGGEGDDYFQISGSKGTYEVIGGAGIDYLDFGTNTEIVIRVNGKPSTINRGRSNVGVFADLEGGIANTVVRFGNTNSRISQDQVTEFYKYSNGSGGFWGGVTEDLGEVNLLAADVNGDGITDLLRQTRDDYDNGRNIVQFFLGDGKGGFTKLAADDDKGNASGAWAIYWLGKDNDLYVGDFNGDKKADVFTLEKGKAGADTPGNAEIYFGDGKGALSKATTEDSTRNIPDLMPMNGDFVNVIVGDYDGDGKDDFIRQKKSTWATQENRWSFQVYLSKGDGTFKKGPFVDATQCSPGTDYTFNGENANIYTGDFNGDGKTDILRQERGSLADKDNINMLCVYTSDGVGGFTKATADGSGNANGIGNAQDFNGNTTRLYVADFNGDGKADILRQRLNTYVGIRTGVLQIFYGDGKGGFTAAPADVNSNVAGMVSAYSGTDSYKLILGKFTNTGKTPEILRIGSSVIFEDNFKIYTSADGATYSRVNLNDISQFKPIIDNSVKVWSSNARALSLDLLASDNAVLMTGDFNGDGITDILRQQNSDAASGKSIIQVFYGAGNGSFNEAPVDGTDNLAVKTAAGTDFVGTTTNLYVGDFNGDGKADFLRQEKGALTKNDKIGTARIVLNDGKGGFSYGLTDTNSTLADVADMDGEGVNVIVGDFDGDGKADFARQEKGTFDNDGKDVLAVYFSKGDGSFKKGEAVDTSGNAKGISSAADFSGDNVNLYAGDFNGDGKVDILRQRKSGYGANNDNTLQVYLSDGTGGFSRANVTSTGNANGITASDFQAPLAKLYIADVNGDGKADIIRQESGSWATDKIRMVNVFLGDGTGGFTKAQSDADGNAFGLPWSSFNGDSSKILVGKFTGNRYFDIVRQGKVGDKDGVLSIYRNDHFGRFDKPTDESYSKFKIASDRTATFQSKWGEVWKADDLSMDNAVLTAGDFNGDGIADILRVQKADTNAGQGLVQVFLGTGNGIFTKADTDTSGNAKGITDLKLAIDKTDIYVGDFNGDGISDVLIAMPTEVADPTAKDPKATITKFFTNVMLGDGKGGFIVPPPAKDGSKAGPSIDVDRANVNILMGDFDGDGKTDFLRQEKGSHDDDNTDVLAVYFSKGDGSFNKADVDGSGNANGIGTAADFSGDNVTLYAGDFNGDGKADILRQERVDYVTGDNNTLQVYFSDGKGGFAKATVDATTGNAIGVTPYDFQAPLARLYVADVNGDGKADIIRQKSGFWANDKSGMISVFLGDGTGGFNKAPTDIEGNGNAKGLPWANFDGRTSNIVVGKFTGSKYFDLLRQGKSGDMNGGNQFYQNDRQGSFDTASVNFDPDHDAHFVTVDNYVAPMKQFNTGTANLMVGDFNGDGYADILCAAKNPSTMDNSLQIWNGDGSGTFTLNPNNNGNGNAAMDEGLNGSGSELNFITGDFNGDGYTDFIRQEFGNAGSDDYNTCQIYINQKNNQFKRFGDYQNGTLKNMVMSGDNANLIVGDFNGDGKDDIIRQEKGYYANKDNRDTIAVYFTGSSGIALASDITTSGNANGLDQAEFNGDKARLFVGDFDGDGKADVLRQQIGSGSASNVLRVYKGNGAGGFTKADADSSGNAAGITASDFYTTVAKLYVGDFNGDGKADMLRQRIGGTSTDVANTLQLFIGDGKGGFTKAPVDDKGNMRGITHPDWFDGKVAQLLIGKFGGTKFMDLYRQGQGADPHSGEVYRNDERNGFDSFADNYRGGSFTISGIESVRGTKAADILNGNDQDNTINGYGGADIIHGGSGKDTLIAMDNDSQAQIFGDAGDDTIMISGSKGIFYVDGGSEADGNSGKDVLDLSLWAGGATAHVNADMRIGKAVLSTRGWDTGTVYMTQMEGIRGTLGFDTIIGDGNDNIIVGDDGNDTLTGNGGNDSIAGSNGHDVLYGGDGNDILKDQSGNNRFYGGAGDDQILSDATLGVLYADGGDGDDIIQVAGFGKKNVAHAGSYTIDGGAGRDVADFSAINLGTYFNKVMNDTTTATTRDSEIASYFRQTISAEYAADFNGDGLTDILRQEKGGWATDEIGMIQVWLSDGKGGFYRAEADTNGNANGVTVKDCSFEGMQLNVGDFNGDGKADFIGQAAGSRISTPTNALIYFGDGKGGFKKGPVDNNGGLTKVYDLRADCVNVIVADFDGDGRDDFVRYEKASYAKDNNSMLEVYLSNGDGTFRIGSVGSDGKDNAPGISPETVNGDTCNLFAGDFNGDGYADLLRQEKGSLATDMACMLQVFMGDGKGGFLLGETDSVNNNAKGISAIDFNGDLAKLYVADFNGDGKADILRQKKISSVYENAKLIQIYIGDGLGGFSLASSTTPYYYNIPGLTAQEFDANKTALLFGNFSGNGKADMVRINDAVSVDTFFSKGDGTFMDTKGWARNGRGVKIDLSTGKGYAVYVPTGGNMSEQGGAISITNVEDLRGTNGNDYLCGNDQSNAFDGMEGNDELYGNGGNDTLLDDDGEDKIYGGAGDDVLISGLGDDLLDSGTGNDYMEGGSGSDRYVFTLNGGYDTIKGFQGYLLGEADVLQIDSSYYRVWAEFSKIMVQEGSDVIIKLNDSNGIKLTDVKLADISQKDVVFA